MRIQLWLAVFGVLLGLALCQQSALITETYRVLTNLDVRGSAGLLSSFTAIKMSNFVSSYL